MTRGSFRAPFLRVKRNPSLRSYNSWCLTFGITIVGISIFISMMNTTSESLKAIQICFFSVFLKR